MALGAALVALSWDELLTNSLPTADELAFQEHVEYLLSQPAAAGLALPEELAVVPGVDRLRPSVGDVSQGKRWKSLLLMRVQTDSAGGGTRRAAVFARAGCERGPWQIAGMFEKDRGESNPFDFVGGGLRYCPGRLNAVLGNYDFGTGQGLVFSSSYGRSSSLPAEDAGPASSLRLAHHADESSPLFGAGAELALGPWSVASLFSSTGRDARLNPDGSVERLETGGVHDDSAALARRSQVRALLGGGAARYRAGPAEVGLHIGLVGYSRNFSPTDTANSFAGRNLADFGIAGSAKIGFWRLEAEAAACATGLAGAARIVGDWEALSARATARWHSRRYFSPYGRWTGLSGRQDRLEASGGLEWKRAGLRVGVSGNTYRDFALDSLPARVEIRAGQRLGRFGCDLRLGRSFRLAEERYRTARLDVTGRAGRLSAVRADFRLTLRDEYPEARPGRGRSVQGEGTVRHGCWQLGVALARFDIAGSGLRMYASEPGAMRIGSAYSTSRSAWRAAVGLALELQRTARLGLKVGWEHAGQPVWDAAAQVDVTTGR